MNPNDAMRVGSEHLPTGREMDALDGFVAGAFWGARYRDERDMKPTGAEILAAGRQHARARVAPAPLPPEEQAVP